MKGCSLFNAKYYLCNRNSERSLVIQNNELSRISLISKSLPIQPVFNRRVLCFKHLVQYHIFLSDTSTLTMPTETNAVKISNRQIRGFYESAKSELGYTSEQLRNSPKLRAEVDRLKFQKLGQWMDANGASAYKVGNSYAVSDAVANRGIATSLG